MGNGLIVLGLDVSLPLYHGTHPRFWFLYICGLFEMIPDRTEALVMIVI